MNARPPGWRDLVAAAARDLLGIQIVKHLGPAAKAGHPHEKDTTAACTKTGSIVEAPATKCRVVS